MNDGTIVLERKVRRVSVTKKALYGYQNLCISKELHKQLKDLSAQTGRPMMELMELALDQFVKRVKIVDGKL